jgi:hypothetical protein
MQAFLKVWEFVVMCLEPISQDLSFRIYDCKVNPQNDAEFGKWNISVTPNFVHLLIFE